MIPPQTIVAAVDFSEPSRVALVFAARLARHGGSELHVVHAQDPLLAAAATARGVDLAADTQRELQAFVATAAPGAAARLHVLTGPPVDIVLDIALREGADAIVMGVRGMGAAERALFGSTTENVLRQADVSVFAIPDDWTPPRPDSADLAGTGPLVVGVDFEIPSRAAARDAGRLAAALATSVELVHVVRPPAVLQRWRADADQLVAEQMATAGRELASLTRDLADVPALTRIESGRVEERLTAVAAPGPDRHPVLVLGRRVRPDRHGAPGAIAYRILSVATIPVLVCVMES